jgi:ABC-type amino acid transport substrate-binding protein
MLFVLILTAAHCPAAQRWHIMTEELPPYNFLAESVVRGISTDIFLRIMERNGMDINRSDIRMMPWPRAYRMVRDIPGSILFSTARTEEREKLFKWVGPITRLTIALLARKDADIRLDSLEDAARYTIGTIRDGAPEQLVIRGGVPLDRLDRIASPELNIKKLQAGRIDLFAFNVPSTRYLMVRMGIDPDEYEPVYILKQADLYYAFHLDTDSSLISRLNRTLEKMRHPDKSGRSEVDRIIENYHAP